MKQERHTPKAEQTRNRIMDAARLSFAQHGLYGSRVDDIAKTAGVNKASIYYYFSDKDGLYAAVLDAAITMVGDAVETADTTSGSMEERLVVFARAFARAIAQSEFLAPVMLRELATGGVNLPDSVAPKYVRVFNVVRCIIDDCASTTDCPDIHPLLVHLMFVGSTLVYTAGEPVRHKFTEMVPELADRPLDMDPEDAAGTIARIFARGLANADPDRQPGGIK